MKNHQQRLYNIENLNKTQLVTPKHLNELEKIAHKTATRHQQKVFVWLSFKIYNMDPGIWKRKKYNQGSSQRGPGICFATKLWQIDLKDEGNEYRPPSNLQERTLVPILSRKWNTSPNLLTQSIYKDE